MLSVEKVRAERSDMSAAVDDVKSLISRDNSLDVYDDKSLISLEVRDLTELMSRTVSLLRSLISVFKVENVSEERSDISAAVDELKSLISRDNSLDVYDDKSEISFEVRDAKIVAQRAASESSNRKKWKAQRSTTN